MKTAHDLVAAAKARIQEVPLDQAEAAIARADVLLDVREDAEFAAGHLPGAVHASRGMLEFKLSSQPALAAAAMQDMGYLDVVSIAGGFDAWVAAGKPVHQPELPSFD